MQAVILCGGQGTRIRDVVEDIPKPMIPIGGQPILWHIMKMYAQHGVTRFVLCLGYKSWVIKRFFLDYHLAHSDLTVALGKHGAVQIHDPNARENWEVSLVETGLDTMTGGRVKQIERYIQGDSFFLTYGDGVADVNFHELMAFHRRHGKLGTVTAVRPPGRFGEIELDGSLVEQFAEKPLLSRGYINGGFFVFQRDFFDRLSHEPDLVLEQAPLGDLARDGELMAFLHQGFWHPMDNSRDYRHLNELWEQRQAPWRVWDSSRLRPAA
ncbi:MAG: glucose-1-phosphate cytidylyltransferase [Gemmataceae bacterium]|nr:glucose-1-phosphate cytidylyltransferase [Gemmataceae bacterium]